jgi:hypothetical protein
VAPTGREQCAMRPGKTLIAAAIAAVALAGTATGVAAATNSPVGSAVPHAPAAAPVAAKAAHHVRPNPLTGYPTKINTINLDGYQIVTSYPLGKLDAGSTYLQTYTNNTVTAVAIAGPYVGSPAVTYNYIAMPITHNIMLLVWLEPNFQHNTFVYNFYDHESSVVTYDQAGDPSLGSVFIVKRGLHRIP